MNLQGKIWWLIPGASLILGALYALLMHYGFDWNWFFASREGLLFCIQLWLGGSLLWIMLRIYPTGAAIMGYALAAGLAAGACASWVHSIIAILLTQRNGFGDGFTYPESIVYLRSSFYLSLFILFSVVVALYRRMEELEQRYALQQDAASLLREAELFRLRQQMQPHFLYNSLNAISALIYTDPEKATLMIGRLSDFLRSSVRQGQSEKVSLKEEVEYLKNYLWIEAVRFGSRLEIEWHIPESLPEAQMPPFLLQPLMENAIRYGLYGHTGQVQIEIRIRMQGSNLLLSLRNPFDPDMRPTGGTGFGLEAVRRRLYLTYARQDLLKSREQSGYFEVIVQIPQEYVQSNRS